MKYKQKAVIDMGEPYIVTFGSDERPITYDEAIRTLVWDRRFDPEIHKMFFLDEDPMVIKINP